MKIRTFVVATLGLGLIGQSYAPSAPAPADDKEALAAAAAESSKETTRSAGALTAQARAIRRPLTVEPLVWLYAQKLVASDGAAGDLFGKTATLSADTAAFGAPEATVTGQASAGAAYVFVRGATWTEQAKLTASDVTTDAEFGRAIALASDTVVVGAPGATAATTRTGGAYVFVRSGTTWTQQAKLVAADGATNDQFGSAVAISGDTILVGAPYAPTGGKPAAGATYVFVRSGTTWTQQTKLVAADAATTDLYGWQVAVAGDTAVSSAPQAGVGADANAGATYIYVRSGTTWMQQAKLSVPTTGFYGYFGYALALAGDTLSVGTRDTTGYIYVRSGTTWSQQLKAAPLDYRFGEATAVLGETALFGTPGKSTGVGTTAGNTHIFTRSGAAWTDSAQLRAADAAPGDLFGTAVALSSDWLVAGAPEANLGPLSKAGAAYAFQLGTSKANGQSCVATMECASGNCIDAVCCDTTCGDGSTADCQACSVAAGATTDGTCGVVSAAVICRPASDVCDAAETCNGTSLTCPADKAQPAGTVCRAAAGPCDTAETCTGTARACPADVYKGTTTVCRPAAGLCDRAEYCSGAAVTCPTDSLLPIFSVCRLASGPCDVTEYCSGFARDCPVDSLTAKGTTCRAAAGPCDAVETCSGTAADCPTDVFQPSTVTCRAAAKDCDAPELCSGASATCPSDQQSADGAQCSMGVCAHGLCQPQADLQVGLVASPVIVHGSQPVQFTATVGNGGRGEAAVVLLTLAYPPTAALAQLGGPGWGCQSAPGGAVCTLDKLAAVSSATLTMELLAPMELAVFNVSAQAKATTPDPVPENNFVTVLIKNDSLGPIGPLPDLGGGSLPDLAHGGTVSPEPSGGCSYAQERRAPTAPLGFALAGAAVLSLCLRRRRRLT